MGTAQERAFLGRTVLESTQGRQGAQGDPLRKLLQKPESMRAGIEEGGVPTTSTSTYPRPLPHTHAAPQAVDRLLECGGTISDKQNLPHLEARNGN